jgi:hypothetical protein
VGGVDYGAKGVQMTQQQKPPSLFVFYQSVNSVRVPKFLVPAQSKHEAAELVKDHGLGMLVGVEECDPADLVRLCLPSLAMGLMQLTQMLAVVAQDAAERVNERAKSRLGLVREH